MSLEHRDPYPIDQPPGWWSIAKVTLILGLIWAIGYVGGNGKFPSQTQNQAPAAAEQHRG